ncbi:hypothetical protein BDV96DRAFT_579863 [Lophiotrema nucula]|uniref:Uncharacterized protein n=1 Tax=Lophiotrema nucula TaxID=690887 RepID=A0A6A5Z0F6_9PLEO|nr:hypothetical protein BDV96DRAFT_579863 [Lophiotrema nucula]
MSLLESKRSIKEAESVTRLTELAFIFIPLTFVSSLFSMQIQELSNGVPLRTFIIAAVVAIFVLYGTRIWIRSHIFAIFRSKLMSRARSWTGTKPNESVSLYALARSCGSRVTWRISYAGNSIAWRCTVLILAIGTMVIPVVLICVRQELDLGLRLVVSVIFIWSGFALGYVALSTYYRSAWWHPSRLFHWVWLHVRDSLQDVVNMESVSP